MSARTRPATGVLKVKAIKVSYNGALKCCHTYDPAVTEKYDSGAFCTFEIPNNTNGVLKATACADDDQTYAEDTQANPVDNAYLISVTRGTCASPGTVKWKYWSGSGWSTLSAYCVGGHLNTSCSGWAGSTQGGASGYCKGPGAPDHEWCSHPPNYPLHPTPNCYYGDIPGFTGSGRDYPTIGGKPDPDCHTVYGTAWIVLGSTTADCGWSRTEIRMHGDQINGQCPDTHEWNETHGCVRMQNGSVEALCDMVAAASGRVGLDDIHISVPNP